MRTKLWTIFVILFSLPAVSFSAEKLIFAVDLIRHGDRTPIEAIPTVDYKWSQGLGQLTAEGMRQEYEMGKRFRQKYIETTHLLPANYEHHSIYVRSTDYDRTLMSAQSLLMGLYPAGSGPSADSGIPGLPHKYQPIPVHSAPKDADDVILHHVDAKERERLMQKYVYSNPEWKQKEAELKKNFARWSAATGIDIKALDHLERIGDTLFIHQVHHIPMPTGLTDNDIQTIIETSDWVFMAEEKPKQIADAYSKQLLTNIANYLQKGSHETSKLKYVLLSAHDSTIASALSALSAPLSKSPPYASDLNFSLYESGARNYVVKVTYNGTPVSIPGCGGTICSLQKFDEIARGNIR